jgi:hypothetical protein
MFALIVLIVLIVGVALRRHTTSCSLRPPSGPNPADASFWVASAVAGVPCQSTGRAVYDLHDSARQAMAGLDPVADPSGGYLGVYAPAPGSASGMPAPGSRVLLGRSSNLRTWRRVRVLAAADAGSPTLEPVAGGGYLLAFQSRRIIELRFYPSLPALLAASQAASIDLPLQLSNQNGAPSFQSVAWNGGLRRSRLTIAFDYLSGGLEREGIGVIRGFRSWSARPDSTADQQLDQRGLTGNHGQQRQFTVSGRSWRILEAQDLIAAKAGTQAGWHIALDDPIRNEIFPLKLGTENGALSTSFGRPVARILPAPTGGGQALVVSMYVFGVGPASSERGELLYWTPIASG